MQRSKRVVVAIYIDLVYYPPTLSAVLTLAEQFDEVVVVTKNQSLEPFPFPRNVTVKKLFAYQSVKSSEQAGLVRKIYSFLAFTFSLLREILRKPTSLVVVYDIIPLFSLWLISPIAGAIKKWYHNHDVFDMALLRKYSIGWFAAKYEKKALLNTDYFTLPSAERTQYYPYLNEYKGALSILPNYPSKNIWNSSFTHQGIMKPGSLKLIYQGHLGSGHGFEEIINFLADDGAEHSLHLVGPINDNYRQSLTDKATATGVANRLFFHDRVTYLELVKLTPQFNVGVAIHKPVDRIYATGGTASNKITEYAAAGLPVLLFDNDHYRKYYSKYNWAFFTDCTTASLKACISEIAQNYNRLSLEARRSFETELNFEVANENFFIQMSNSLK